MARPLVAAVVVVASVGVARAQDDGLFGFFQQAFGGGGGQSGAALPQPEYADPSAPPLTVQMHHRHRRRSVGVASTRMTAAELKDVTIYTDKTLAPGDAVMTARGIRIFAGSASWPYKDDDFVALSEGRLPKSERKELSAMDVASRPEFGRR